jgi:phosphate transport system substrate-binding protein
MTNHFKPLTMRTTFLLIFLLIMSVTFTSFIPPVSVPASGNHITLSGAFALYPLAVKWAEEYKKIHPDVRIDLTAGGAGKGMTDVLNNMVDIGMVSREVYPEEVKKGAFAIAVAKDAVVAVVNANNPAINDIITKGLKKDAANNIWITGKYKSWAQAFATKTGAPIHVYTRSDACGAAEVWAKYFGKKQEDLLGSGVFGDPGLALAVKKDPLGIGFNNIGYAYDHTTKKQVAGIRIVPIDLNNNGKVDPDENFYNTMDEIVNAIAEGKYPSPPARELYFVTKGKITNKAVAEFIRWALTDGQKFVHESGYIALPKEKLAKEVSKLK